MKPVYSWTNLSGHAHIYQYEERGPRLLLQMPTATPTAAPTAISAVRVDTWWRRAKLVWRLVCLHSVPLRGLPGAVGEVSDYLRHESPVGAFTTCLRDFLLWGLVLDCAVIVQIAGQCLGSARTRRPCTGKANNMWALQASRGELSLATWDGGSLSPTVNWTSVHKQRLRT